MFSGHATFNIIILFTFLYWEGGGWIFACSSNFDHFFNELQTNFPIVLDEYIKQEVEAKGLDKESVILSLVISELDGGYEIGINTYEFLYSPHIDNLLLYKKVKVVIGAPLKIKNQIDTFFEKAIDSRVLQQEEIYTIHETLSHALFQFNKKESYELVIQK